MVKEFWGWARRRRLEEENQRANAMLDVSEDTKQRVLFEDLEIFPGVVAMIHVSRCSWWKWDGGSAPFYWQFENQEWQTDFRDGV